MDSSVWISLDSDLTVGESPTPRTNPGLASMDDKLYIFGGMRNAAGILFK
jgi:hypothetical protein